MPDRSNKITEAYADADGGDLPYISKSRVKTWLSNPDWFYYKYVKEIKQKETDPMVRGTRIHETFEKFYEAEVRHGKEMMSRPELYLPADRQLWADFINPYVNNFLKWERKRLRYADQTGSAWAPVAIEEELWVDPVLGLNTEPEWMGLADVVIPAGAFPFNDSDDGVVIVDFKTGSVPDEQYRDEGIYTELEYYTILFEQEYNVSAAAAYYPRENETVVQPDDDSFRENVLEAVEEMVTAVEDGSTDMFPHHEGPLCGWSEAPGDRNPYCALSSKCSWNVPRDNKERFLKLKERGLSDIAIAHKMGTSIGAARYWGWKMD